MAARNEDGVHEAPAPKTEIATLPADGTLPPAKELSASPPTNAATPVAGQTDGKDAAVAAIPPAAPAAVAVGVAAGAAVAVIRGVGLVVRAGVAVVIGASGARVSPCPFPPTRRRARQRES